MLISTSSNSDDKPNHGLYFLVFAAALTILAICSKQAGWHSTEETLSVIETATALMAFVVGVIAICQYLSTRKNKALLVIGTGFLAITCFDGLHIAATAGHLDIFSPPEINPLLAPWSAYASHLFLPVLFGLCGLAWRSESDAQLSSLWGRPEVICLAAFAAAATSLIIVAELSVLQTRHTNLPLTQPEELIPTGLFFLALLGHLRSRFWRWNAFAYWLVLALIVSVFGQMALITDSQSESNTNFAFHPVYGLFAYACVLFGLLSNMYAGFWRLRRAIDECNQTDELLKEREIRCRTVVDKMADALITVDDRGFIETINPAAEKLFGHFESSIVGKSINQLIPAAFTDPPESNDESSYFAAENSPFADSRGELFGLSKKGKRFPLNLTVTEMQIGAKLIFNILVRDISLSKNTDPSLGLNEQVCKALGTLIEISLDADSSDQLVEDSVDFLISLEFLNLTDKTAIYLTDEDNNNLFLACARNLPEKSLKQRSELPANECIGGMDGIGNARLGCQLVEQEQHDPDKNALNKRYNIPIQSNDNVAGIFILFLDREAEANAGDIAFLKIVSDILVSALQRIAIQANLHTGNQSLKKSLQSEKSVSAKFTETIKQLNILEYQAANIASTRKALSEKIDRHIRAPVNAINDVIQRLSDTDLDEEQREYVKSLNESGESILALVDDVLDLSVVKDGKPNLESSPLDLETVAESKLLETGLNEDVLATEDDIAEIKNADTIDTSRLASLKENVGYEYDNLVLNYIETTQTLLESIPPAYKQQKSEEIKRIANKLKLSSANVGAMKIAALAKQLETQANANQLTHIPKLLMKLLANFERVNDELVKPKVTDLFG